MSLNTDYIEIIHILKIMSLYKNVKSLKIELQVAVMASSGYEQIYSWTVLQERLHRKFDIRENPFRKNMFVKLQ